MILEAKALRRLGRFDASCRNPGQCLGAIRTFVKGVLRMPIGACIRNSSKPRCMRWYYEVVEIPHASAKMSMFELVGSSHIRSLHIGQLHDGEG